jgi:hypothetical protein
MTTRSPLGPWFRSLSRRGRPRRIVRPRLEQLEARETPSIEPLFAPVQVNSGLANANNTNAVTRPDIGVASDGSFDVVFTRHFSATDDDVVVSRFNVDGTPKATNPTIFVASSGAVETDGRIAVNPDGSFVVAYTAPTAGGFRSVFAKIYDTTGTQVGGTVQVPTTGFNTRDQDQPAIAGNDAGNFAVSWTDHFSATDLDVRFRAFNPDGSPQDATDIAVATSAAANEFESSIAFRHVPVAGATPAFVVSYTSAAAGLSGVFYRRFDGNRAPLDASGVQANTTANADQSSVDIASNLDFVVAFRASNQIFMRRFAGDGTAKTTADEGVSTVIAPSQSRPDVAVANDGRFVIAFGDTSTTPNRAAFREFDAFGHPQGSVRPFSTAFTTASLIPTVDANASDVFGMASDVLQGATPTPFAGLFQQPPRTFFAAGSAPDTVVLFNLSGAVLFQFNPFPLSYTGGVTVAVGDINGDGVDDLAVGAATGNPQVNVYNGKTLLATSNPAMALITAFNAYDVGFNVGVFVAVGDVDGDGFADVATGASPGNPHVRVLSGAAIASGTFTFDPASAADNTVGNGKLLASFFAYDTGFNVGATVAVGDVNADGFADVVTGASRGNPNVRVFSGLAIRNNTLPTTFTGTEPSLLANFFPYGLGFNVGANVAAGDVNGDGFADIVSGATIGNPDVRVFNGAAIAAGTFNYQPFPDPNQSVINNNLLAVFFAYDLNFNVGATVAVLNASGTVSILTGPSTGSSNIRRFNPLSSGVSLATTPPPLLNISIPGLDSGVYVG